MLVLQHQATPLHGDSVSTATSSYTFTRWQCSYCNTTRAYVQLHKGGKHASAFPAQFLCLMHLPSSCVWCTCPVPVSDAPAQFLPGWYISNLCLMHPPSSYLCLMHLPSSYLCLIHLPSSYLCEWCTCPVPTCVWCTSYLCLMHLPSSYLCLMHLLPVSDAPVQFLPVSDAPAQFLLASDAPAQFLPVSDAPAQFLCLMHLLLVFQFLLASDAPAPFLPVSDAPAQVLCLMHLLPVFDAPAQFLLASDAPAQFLPVSDAPAQGLVQSTECLDLIPQVTWQQTPRWLITIIVLPLQLHLATESLF